MTNLNILGKVKAKKETKERIARLRMQRDSYLDKARECAVYDHAAGYKFWLQAAREAAHEIAALGYAR